MPTHFLGAGVEASDRDILGEICDLAQQHAVAGDPEDVADAVALAERDGLDAATMATPADQDFRSWPMGTEMPDDVAQYEGHLGTVGSFAGTKEGRDRVAEAAS